MARNRTCHIVHTCNIPILVRLDHLINKCGREFHYTASGQDVWYEFDMVIPTLRSPFRAQLVVVCIVDSCFIYGIRQYLGAQARPSAGFLHKSGVIPVFNQFSGRFDSNVVEINQIVGRDGDVIGKCECFPNNVVCCTVNITSFLLEYRL